MILDLIVYERGFFKGALVINLAMKVGLMEFSLGLLTSLFLED
jgi:hypothetical protein